MSRPCFRRPPLQSGRSIFYDTSPFSSYPVDFKYINRCTCQDLYALTKCEGTYLNIANKTLGGPLHPLRLLDLGDLFVAGPVVSTLAPYTDTLASIVGAPLDLLHLVVGVRLGPLALCAPPHHGQGHHWSLTEVGSTLRRGSLDRRLLQPSRGWSFVLLFCPTAWWGSGHSTLIPRRGICVGSFSGRVLGDLCRRRGNCGSRRGLLRGSLPHSGLTHDSCFRWPRAQNGARVNIRGSAAKIPFKYNQTGIISS